MDRDLNNPYRFAAGFTAGYDLGQSYGFQDGWQKAIEQYDEPNKEKRAEQEAILKKHYNSIPYTDYLASAHWQSMRELKKKVMGGTLFCQLDRTHTGPFDIHHNTYDRRGNEEISDLICLCRSCHEKHHGRS